MKIFLGYPSEYEAEARQVYTFLHDQLGHEVWFDKVALFAGTDWDAERIEGQNSAALIVHLCSPEIGTRKGVVNREIRMTLDLTKDQAFGALFVVFVRLVEFRLPVEFRRYQWIDYFSGDWRERLREAVRRKEAELSGDMEMLAPPVGERVSTHEAPGDPTRLDFSDDSELYTCGGSYLSYPDADIYWRYVNASIATHALDGFFWARHNLRDISKLDEQRIRDFGFRFSWQISAEEFFRHNDVVSIRLYGSDFKGGRAW